MDSAATTTFCAASSASSAPVRNRFIEDRASEEIPCSARMRLLRYRSTRKMKRSPFVPPTYGWPEAAPIASRTCGSVICRIVQDCR